MTCFNINRSNLKDKKSFQSTELTSRRVNRLRCHFISLILLFSSHAVHAQSIQGRVTDAETQEPVEMATVVLERNGTPLDYALTNAQGYYFLKRQGLRKTDNLSISYLGYEKTKQQLKEQSVIDFLLKPQAFTLKEVEIKGNRISSRQDTTSYDLSRFITGRDNNLKEVLKKLPGINVSKNGVISYNGKNISKFTVEGMDVTGGRYNLINESLKAQDVDKAEIIDHFQPVRSLAQKIHSEDVALNIKLKAEAKESWIFTLKAENGLSDKSSAALWNENINALQIGKKKQCIYDLKADNTGKDIVSARTILTGNDEKVLLGHGDRPVWLYQPSLDSPLEEEKLRLNRTYSASRDQIRSPQPEKQIRVSTGYLHDELDQQTSNSSVYHLNNNQDIETDELQHSKKTTDALRCELNIENNKENSYLKEKMILNGQLENSHSDIQTSNETVNQEIKTPNLTWLNRLKIIRPYGKQTLSFHSELKFDANPAELRLSEGNAQMNSTRYYADNAVSLINKTGFITQQYSIGLCTEDMYLKGHHGLIDIYARPHWEYKRGAFNLYMDDLLEWRRFCEENKTFLLVSPQVYANIKTGFHQEWSAFAIYQQKADNWASVLPQSYRQDYRTFVTNDGTVPRNNFLITDIGYEYKHALHELFFNVHAGYSIINNSQMTDICLNDGNYHLSRMQKDNNTYTYTAKGSVSKGWFGLHLKVALTANYTYTKGLSLINSVLLKYKMKEVGLVPKIIFSPTWGELEYSADIHNSKVVQENNNNKATLWNWVQNLTFTKTIGRIDLNVYLSHYRNDLYTGETSYFTLLNASLTWRLKKVRLSTRLNNLLNRKEYAYTANQGNVSTTNRYILRPREWTVSIQWNI